MRTFVTTIAVAAIAMLALNAPAAEKPKPKDGSDKYGFNYGGKTEHDKPTVPKDDKEKKALAALDEMTKGRWHLNITTREGRVLRQMVE